MLKAHPLNVSSLVVGLILLGLAVSWALRQAGAIDHGDGAWLLPVLLVIAGTAGLVAAVGRRQAPERNNDDDDNTYGEL